MVDLDLATLANSYRERANRAVFGVASDSALDSGRGTAACIPSMIQIYEYYGRLYLERPHRLLWAGLARLAGAPIVHGLAGAVEHGIDNPYCRMLIDTCRRIFADAAWLHEAFLDDPAVAVELAGSEGRGDQTGSGRRRIWADIAVGGYRRVADANRRMLAHEQLVVAQRGYDAFRDHARAMSRSVRAVHPYHDDFGGDDLGDAEQRWAWVEAMWESWAGLPAEERTPLVRLPFDELRARRFAR